jgi:uncharacterized cysteine cluster protein YcgN (CxxCxxCC family)
VSSAEPSLVPDRSCEGCTLCCKLAEVKALHKPMGVWCVHCDIGAGCKIYQARPAECAVFYCLYRLDPQLDEIWRPAACGMVLTYEPAIKRLNIWVDSERGEIWRTAPYLARIRSMALAMLRQQGSLIVWQGDIGFGVLPDREVNLGRLGEKRIVVMGRNTADGEDYDIVALHPDDPRLSNLKPTS